MRSDLARDLACMLRPSLFARLALGLTPDEKQREVLDSLDPQVILNCSRQWGKSTVSSILALHTAMYNPESLTLIVSPSARQSGELVRKVAERLPAFGIKPRSDGLNPISLVFPNRSRIVGLPGDGATIRGFSGTKLLIVDEASQVTDELYRACRPFLAASKDGRLVLVSTPFGSQGFFWDEWERGEGWLRISTPATECPRISAEFLAKEKHSMGETWFRQEYMCEFLESDNSYLPREWVERAFTREVGAYSL
jgi:hypothetical protein